MVLEIGSAGGSCTHRVPGIVIALAFLWCVTLAVSSPANAYLLKQNNPDLCTSDEPDHANPLACNWAFDNIARLKLIEVPAITEGSANLGRLGRTGFAISQLTIDQVGEDHTNSVASMLPWDRQAGVARDLSSRTGIIIEAAQLRSEEFLLLPAAFNPAFLADFVNYYACAAAHTFIFSGALDGRSDAPHVTERSKASKEAVCLDMAGADCRKAKSRFEPRRRYFNSEAQCKYRAKLIYTPIHNSVPPRSIWKSRAP